MRFGYCVVKKAFTREQAAKVTDDVWIRLGMDPNDKETWTKVSDASAYWRETDRSLF